MKAGIERSKRRENLRISDDKETCSAKVNDKRKVSLYQGGTVFRADGSTQSSTCKKNTLMTEPPATTLSSIYFRDLDRTAV